MSTLCSAGYWQCEDTGLMVANGLEDRAARGVEGTLSKEHFKDGLRIFAKYWDLSKPVLMDKTPVNMYHAKEIKAAADELGVAKTVFLVLTRSAFTIAGGNISPATPEHMREFKEDLYLKAMGEAWKILSDPSLESYQLKYEDLAEGTDFTKAKLEARFPELKPLNVHKNGVTYVSPTKKTNWERGLPIREYFKTHKLNFERKTLRPETAQLMCNLGYNDGCTYKY